VTRLEFSELLDKLLDQIRDLFSTKNQSYGAGGDVFHNFRNTARRVLPQQFESEHEEMFRVLAVYADKHWVALCNKGLSDSEFEERCKDIMVYMTLAIAMKKDAENAIYKESEVIP
jgi:hypothetical protein